MTRLHHARARWAVPDRPTVCLGIGRGYPPLWRQQLRAGLQNDRERAAKRRELLQHAAAIC